LPEPVKNIAERRLSVWRRAYALFDTGAVGPGGAWTGPFREAGYGTPVIEPILDNDSRPDMLAVTDNWRAVIEISCSPNKEFERAREYPKGNLSAPLKAVLGDRPRKSAGETFFVTEESGIKSFPKDMNAVNVYPPFASRLPSVNDGELLRRLREWKGFPGPVASYNLMALPESGIDEIRFQLAGILRQVMFDGATTDAASIADRLLGELAPAVSAAGKRELVVVCQDMLPVELSGDLAALSGS
jgi:hypothetical protein